MPLDPQLKAYLDQFARPDSPPRLTLTPQEARRAATAMTDEQRDLLLVPPSEQVVESAVQIVERTIPGPGGDLLIRLYRPQATGVLPLVVYFHGGGWVLANFESHDRICRSIAHEGECVVVAAEYRLAPEHKFPAAPADCYDATE